MSSTSSYDEEDLEGYLYSDIRNELNLDDETLQSAWDYYRQISSKFALEGNKVEWLACAVYTSCRKCVTQTMGKNKIDGNLVSLTRLLRCCNINLVNFFNKMQNWIEMYKLPEDFRNKLVQLECNFQVTTCIFKKYKPIFEDIFKCASQMPCRFIPKNRKQIRKQALNSLDVFTFCWTLFVYIKSNYSKISDDLVNSYHLLFVCIDYCFSSVLLFDNYKDIINTNFYDMLSKELNYDPRSRNNDNRISIIDVLCKKWGSPSLTIEVKHIEKHFFKPFLKRLIDRDDLRKKTNGIIDPDVVDNNFKFIKREYENFVLSDGDFDECVFLNETASEELGMSQLNKMNIDERLYHRTQFTHPDPPTTNNLIPQTPISSNTYLGCRTPVSSLGRLTPISSATGSIGRLHSILTGRTNGPSKDLIFILNKYGDHLVSRIDEIIQNMSEIFIEAYVKDNFSKSVIKSTDEIQCIVISDDAFAKNRQNMAVTFFYYIFEKILKSELRQRVTESGGSEFVNRVMEQGIFVRALFACCLEIIIFSYSLVNRVFPWIIDIYFDNPTLKIHPFYFYKVIEPIIREEPYLSRDIVKHLNTIEERILDCLAWRHDSPIWIILKQFPVVPLSAEVQLNFFGKRENGPAYMNSPAVKTHVGSMVNAFGIVNGPKRQLCFENQESGLSPNSEAVKTSVVVSVGNNNCRITPVNSNHVEETGATKESQCPGVIQKAPPANPIPDSPNSEKSKSQLNLFFRKVYSMTCLRMKDLCFRLEVTSEEIQAKIWTFLEHAISQHTDLLCDHHIDQLMMCSIYGICKLNIVGDREIPFKEIIRQYRLQPQATNNNQIYREVILAVRRSEDFENNQEPERAEEGTVIDFYNKVFIQKVGQTFMKQFSANSPNSPPLSPMPPSRFASPIINSPVRPLPNCNILVSPMKSSNPNPSPSRLTCRFGDHNPSRDLKQINNLMKSSANPISRNNAASVLASIGISSGIKRASKRILQDDDCETSQSKLFCTMSRKLHSIISDRQSMSVTSSANASATEDSNDSFPVVRPSSPRMSIAVNINSPNNITILGQAPLAHDLSTTMANGNPVIVSLSSLPSGALTNPSSNLLENVVLAANPIRAE